MDEVLVDFIKGACDLHGYYGYRPKSYDFFKTEWGMSSKNFWAKIDKCPGFWENLDKLPWCDELIDFIKNNNYVFTICSAPSLSKDAPSGKVIWLKKYFGNNFYDYQLGKDKYLMANPNHLLIDDSEEQCSNFIEYGGNAILFPTESNINRKIKNKIKYVCDQIKQFYSS